MHLENTRALAWSQLTLHARQHKSVSAGVGGLEAMLFARELFSMYARYAEFRGWAIQVTKCDQVPVMNSVTGYRCALLHVRSTDAYGWLKFEAGVHRVQRVPITEKNGRMHTSMANLLLCSPVATFLF